MTFGYVITPNRNSYASNTLEIVGIVSGPKGLHKVHPENDETGATASDRSSFSRLGRSADDQKKPDRIVLSPEMEEDNLECCFVLGYN